MVGPRLSTIIVPHSCGALKLRKQIPPTIAPADMQASVAATQSPVARLISAPYPTLPFQATESSRFTSVGVGRRVSARRRARMRTARRVRQIAISTASQAMNNGLGERAVIAAATRRYSGSRR